MKSISPEFDLLCRLLPVHFRGGLAFPAGWGAVDPEAFRRFVVTTQVAPHALHVWERTPALWETTPSETRARVVAWQELFYHRQELRFETWKELLAGFASAGIPVIALKGFDLSQYLYGEPSRRLSCDVDLLVHPQDLSRIETLLPDLGFQPAGWLGTWAAVESSWGRNAPDGGDPVNLDIHWDFTPSWHFLRAPLNAIWDEAEERVTGGIRHWMLGPAGTALFSLVNNTTDYGLGNLRGCVETLEVLSLLEGDAVARFSDWAHAANARRALAVLEIFRSRFLPASRPDVVTRFRPAPRLLLGSRFARWDYYLHQGEPPKWRQAGVRFALAGPTPRFLRFCAGKVIGSLVMRGQAPRTQPSAADAEKRILPDGSASMHADGL